MTGNLYESQKKAVLREYASAMLDGAKQKARKIRAANVDLKTDFDRLDKAPKSGR